MRNIPVGGGCRKTKKSSSKRSQDQQQSLTPNDMLPWSYDTNDLTLNFARLQKQSGGQLGFDDHDFPILGNPNLVSSSSAAANPGFLGALRSSFVETQNYDFQDYYYGFGNEMNMGREEVDNIIADGIGSVGVSGGETMLPTSGDVKQELCNGAESENKMLWGLPSHSQLNIGDQGNAIAMGDLDSSGRQSWNGLNSSSWHGLLNNPLM